MLLNKRITLKQTNLLIINVSLLHNYVYVMIAVLTTKHI